MKKVFLLLVAILVFCTVMLFFFIRNNQNRIIYEKMWDVSIPYSAREVYSVTSEIGFNGDGIRYTVYENCGSDPKGATFDYGADKKTKEEFFTLLGSLNVPDEMKPEFSEDYTVCRIEKNNDFILLIMSEDCLYVLQWTG